MGRQRGTRILGILASAGSELRAIVQSPDRLLEQAGGLAADGADLIDLDTLPGGAVHGIDAAGLARVIAFLVGAEHRIAVTVSDAVLAETAVASGAECIIDPSGMTADARMREVAAASTCDWALGPWSLRPHDWYADASGPDAYADGLVRNLAALLDAGVRSDQIVLHAGAGIDADDPAPWRMLNHLDQISAIGYPILVDARDDILTAISADDSPERLADAAVGAAALAAGFRAWGIRTRHVARVADAVHRIRDPRASA